MTRIKFENSPSTNTPINAENLNKLNNVIVSSKEPTTGEEVWIDNVNKKIHTKTDNGYEEFYNEENREVYSTSEQRIGTWIDGKPLYRQIFEGDMSGFSTGSTSKYKAIASNIKKVINAFSTKTNEGGDSFIGNDILLLSTGVMRFQYLISDGTFTKYYAVVEYTKTTD